MLSLRKFKSLKLNFGNRPTVSWATFNSHENL